MIGTDSHAEPNSLAATEQQPCSVSIAALQHQHSSVNTLQHYDSNLYTSINTSV